MALVLRKCRENSVLAFIFANDVEYAKPLIQARWDMIAIGTDAGWFSASATKAAADLRTYVIGQTSRLPN